MLFDERLLTTALSNRLHEISTLLDAGRAMKLKSLTVTTDTPGLTAQILDGGSATGPFTGDSPARVVNNTATFALNGATARYYVVWITSLGGNPAVHLNAVRASS